MAALFSRSEIFQDLEPPSEGFRSFGRAERNHDTREQEPLIDLEGRCFGVPWEMPPVSVQ